MLPTVVSRVRHESIGYLVLLCVVSLVAAPAQAKPTKVSWPVYISVRAAAHTTNDIRMYYWEVSDGNGSFWDHAVVDSAGVTTRVTEPPSCYPIDRVIPGHPLKGQAVLCPDGTSQEVEDAPTHSIPGQGEDFQISLGDRADRFSAEESIGSFVVRAGSGNDKLYGENEPIGVIDFDTGTSCFYFTEDDLRGDSGDDRLYGRLGPDFLSGGGGNDYLSGGKDSNRPGGGLCAGFDEADELRGGSGNDVLWAADGDRDLYIDCGPGRRDKAVIDPQDPTPKHCEKVKRRG
jgi:hypothetical protein